MTGSQWDAYIASARNFTDAQDRLEEALAAGIDPKALLGAQSQRALCTDCGRNPATHVAEEDTQVCQACLTARWRYGFAQSSDGETWAEWIAPMDDHRIEGRAS